MANEEQLQAIDDAATLARARYEARDGRTPSSTELAFIYTYVTEEVAMFEGAAERFGTRAAPALGG